jgi:hypothetical protein
MSLLKRRPLFLFLLPLFFVLNGFTRHYYFVPIGDALLLAVIYTGSALLIAGLFYLYFRDFTKASLIAFLIMSFHFFFGSVHDAMKPVFEGTFIYRYSFIVSFSFIILITTIIILRKRKKPVWKITSYLNILFSLLIIIDIGWLAIKIIYPGKESQIALAEAGFTTKCDTCKKPDIYFIILDEYSGNTALKDQFAFDNTDFENELTQRGFKVVSNTRSNYNYTPYSVASILNMDYLNLNMKTRNRGNLKYCYETIKNSLVLKFLESNNYTFYNYSIFDFKEQPARNYDNFLPARSKLITAQTFLSRFWKDFRNVFIMGKFSFKTFEKKFTYSHLHNNENFLKYTREIAGATNTLPKLVYTHLLMPHYPYYFDSKGNALPFDSLIYGRLFNHHYIEYLQYCNKKILQLTDDILQRSAQPPVIIFSGDHGYRGGELEERRKYSFMNLLAIYLPDKSYTGFYPGMSGVNTFRVFLNTQFKQNLPVLKDSTIYLWD